MEKKVQLFSGGFDSILQEWLIKPDILLYVNMNTAYSRRELEALKKLPDYYQKRLIIKDLPLGEYEREDKYLPYRNLILGAIAMEYGQHVYFGFNRLDDAPDKDRIFIKALHRLFKHLNKNCIGDMHWESTNFSFNAPFQKYTKTQMVKLAIEAGMPIAWVKNNRSCYDGGSEIGCGICGPCIHKAIALVNNGINIEGLFDTPITLDVLTNVYEHAVRSDGYKKEYLYDLERAIKHLKES